MLRGTEGAEKGKGRRKERKDKAQYREKQ